MKQNNKMVQSAPHAEAYSADAHNSQEISALLSVTRTEEIPLVFGRGDMTPGQIIDEMLREGNVSKVALDLNRENF